MSVAGKAGASVCSPGFDKAEGGGAVFADGREPGFDLVDQHEDGNVDNNQLPWGESVVLDLPVFTVSPSVWTITGCRVMMTPLPMVSSKLKCTVLLILLTVLVIFRRGEKLQMVPMSRVM